MKYLMALVAFLAVGGACRGPTYTHNGIALQCTWPNDDNVATCVGGGKTYRCIGTPGGCGVDSCGAYQVEGQ